MPTDLTDRKDRHMPTETPTSPGTIAIVGGGPAGTVAAIALARRGIHATVLEREPHPEDAPRINPDRSYTIDITGHGLRALRHIDATSYFDERMLPFNGMRYRGRVVEEWSEPGWTGSRGDILRTLMSVVSDRHRADVDFEFEARVEAVDTGSGTLTYTSAGAGTMTRRFDLIVGADGAGSVVRRAMQEQVEGFAVERGSIPNYVTMLALDRVGNELDKTCLHALSLRHFYVAGAVNGDDGPATPLWFCAIGANRELSFASADEAREFFGRNCPEILEMASDDAITAFATRPCYHVGQTLTCSQLHGGKAVLLGDAAAAFPPIGQGLNAAMESAAVLDRVIGANRTDLTGAAARFNAAWKPEADAISWISQQTLFENPLNTIRSLVTMALGQNVVGRAKRSDLSYSEIRDKAKRLGPLWT
jgi:2-polyprenyl-6-methoxyphenol hydroxylase-like FAD-dependent oxidoreductase